MSINQSIKPITAEWRENLTIGGCDLSELAKKYGTPLYVIDEETLRGMCREYKEAFKSCKNIKMMYASKALCNLAVAKILDEEGFGFDTVSSGEIYTVRQAGVDMSKVLFNGNNKSRREIELALDLRVGRFSVDNFYEAELLNNICAQRGEKADVLLRITPGIECHTHQYIQTGQTDSKFGFDLSQIDNVFENKYENLNIKGLHAHIGSQIFEMQSYKDEIKILKKEILRIEEKHGVSLKELNIGGGLGVKYTEKDNPPSVYDLADALVSLIKDEDLTIYIEPGRSIISTAGVTLYTVGSSKVVPNGRKYVAVDGGMADNPRPSMYQAEYTAEVANKKTCDKFEEVTIAGRFCESGDILIENISLPLLEAGDTICVYNTGAYNYSMSSNYNRVEKPAMVLVNNSQSDIIVYRESLEDLIVHETVPDRLRR